MKKKVLIFLLFAPLSLFSQKTFNSEIIIDKVHLLESDRHACSCIGWSDKGVTAYLTTVEPEEPVGGFYLDLVVFDLIYDKKIITFRLKDPTSDELDRETLETTIKYLNENNVKPFYVTISKFPFNYKGDSYIIEELSEEEKIKTEKRLKIQSLNTKRYKLLDINYNLNDVVGYFKSPFEDRIAICYFVPVQNGPTGMVFGGGYYELSGCHMAQGFLIEDN